MTERAEALREQLAPAVAGLGLSLYDVLLGGGPRPTLSVVVDRPGGVDLDSIESATRAVSALLDTADPLPGAYTLEVTSPGLERALRRPEHYTGAVGEAVSVKTRTADGAVERIRGVLRAADDEQITVEAGSGDRTIPLAQVVQARTVFEWGPEPKPGRGSKPGSKRGARSGAKREAHAWR